MGIVSISNKFFDKCSKPNELLENTNRRPYVIILKLKYKSKVYDFALPFRSNIASSAPKIYIFHYPQQVRL